MYTGGEVTERVRVLFDETIDETTDIWNLKLVYL